MNYDLAWKRNGEYIIDDGNASAEIIEQAFKDGEYEGRKLCAILEWNDFQALLTSRWRPPLLL